MSIEIKTIAFEQLKVNGKLITLECGAIINQYDLTPEEFKATMEYIERTKTHHIKSSIVNK